MTLRKIGTVLHFSKTKRIIARLDTAAGRELVKKILRIGEIPEIPVYDVKMRKIGYLHDIFGPVNKPYASIKPAKDINPEEVRGIAIYTKPVDLRRLVTRKGKR